MSNLSRNIFQRVRGIKCKSNEDDMGLGVGHGPQSLNYVCELIRGRLRCWSKRTSYSS